MARDAEGFVSGFVTEFDLEYTSGGNSPKCIFSVAAKKSKSSNNFYLQWPADQTDEISKDRFSAMALTVLSAFQNGLQMDVELPPVPAKKSRDGAIVAVGVRINSKAYTDGDIELGFPLSFYVGGSGPGSSKSEFSVSSFVTQADPAWTWLIIPPSYVSSVPALIAAVVAERGSTAVMHTWNPDTYPGQIARAATINVRIPVPQPIKPPLPIVVVPPVPGGKKSSSGRKLPVAKLKARKTN